MSNKCMNYVIEHSEARGSARLVLIMLADMANDDGECWPGKANLAQKCRMEKRNVLMTLQRLEADGEIGIFHRRAGILNHTNLYQINMGGSDRAITRGGDPTITRWGSWDHQGSDPTIPRGGDPTITRSLKESLKESLSDPNDDPPPESPFQKAMREKRERRQ